MKVLTVLASILVLSLLALKHYASSPATLHSKQQAIHVAAPMAAAQLSAIPSFQVEAPTRRIDILLEKQLEVARKTSAGFSAEEAALRTLAQGFSAPERARLASLAQNISQPADLRSMSVYLLSLALPHSLPELTQLAATPLRVSAKDQQGWSRKQELTLRVEALFSIDSVTSEASAKVSLEKILESAADPKIKMLAAIALSGWNGNRPHRLERFADRIMDKKVSL